MAVAYLDTSAIAKLVLDEPGSWAMRRWFVEAERVTSSRIGVIETRRAANREVHDQAHLDDVIHSLEVIELDGAIAGAAQTIGPPSLRTLDAIHLASALALGPELDAFVTYDDRLADAARGVGLPVVRPA